jgi:hypothetical protein
VTTVSVTPAGQSGVILLNRVRWLTIPAGTVQK